MGDDFVPPVKLLLKAIDGGIRLAVKVAGSASAASDEQDLHISQASYGLQQSLERSSQAISEGYQQNVASLGEPFPKALLEDSE